MDAGREQAVVEAVRKLFEEDVRRGRLRPVAYYRRLFPGYDASVARAYETAGAAPAGGTPSEPVPVQDAAAASSAPSDRVGPYVLLRELGRGAQGAVHLAEDTRLPRRVALKVLAPHLVASAAMRDRFRREAAAVARLDHPGICTIYEADLDGPEPFLAMRYVEGASLAERIDTTRASSGGSSGAARTTVVDLPSQADADPSEDEVPTGPVPPSSAPRDRADVMRVARFVEDAARALHVAHEAGFVHRDVKPGNLMVASDGAPVVLDFGLARAEDEGVLTESGVLMGTPAYMSPEQLLAQRVPVDRRTDVYSLGVTLYECLALRRPFDAATRDALYQQILAQEPPPVRRANPRVPADLAVVVETAMAKDRERRYATALDLAEDLRRVRHRLPIRARPAGPVTRLRRWAQRHPAVAASLAAALVSLGGGLAASLTLLRFAREEAQAKSVALEEASRERTAKEAARRRAVDHARRADGLRLAALAPSLVATDPATALRAALLALERAPGPQAREAVYQALQEYVPVRALHGHDGYVSAVAFSPDGTRLLSTSGGEVFVRDAADGRLLVRRVETDDVRLASFVGDGASIVVVLDGGAAHRIDAATGAALGAVGGPAPPWKDAGLSADGTRLFAANAAGDAEVRSTVTGEVLCRAALGAGYAQSAMSPAGDRVAASSGTVVRVWDVATGAAREVAASETPAPVRDAAFGVGWAGPGHVVVATPAGWTLVDAGTLRATYRTPADAHPFFSAELPGGDLVLGRFGGVAEVLDPASGAVRASPLGAVRNLQASRDGRSALAWGAREYTAEVRDVRTGETFAPLRGHRYVVNAVAFHPASDRVATGGADRQVRVWDLRPADRFREFNVARDPRETTAAADLASGVAVVTTRDGPLQAVRIADAAVLRSFPPDGDHHGGRWVGRRRVAVCGAAACRVYDRDTGEIVREIPTGGGRHLAVLSHDGSRLLLNAGGRLRMFDVATGALLGERTLARVIHPAVSPDGRRAAAPGAYYVLPVWDVDAGTERTAGGHGGMVFSAAFSPDGTRVASGAVDRSARIWDAATGRPLVRCDGVPMGEIAVRWSPDGRLLAAAGVLFDAATGERWASLGLGSGWTVLGFGDDAGEVILVGPGGRLRTLPVDFDAWVRRHEPPELAPDEAEQLGLVAPEELVAYLRDFAERHPAAPEYLRLADACAKAGDLDAAVAAARRAIELSPRDWRAPFRLARHLARRGDRDGAVEAIVRALRIDGAVPETVRNEPELAPLFEDPRVVAAEAARADRRR